MPAKKPSDSTDSGYDKSDFSLLGDKTAHESAVLERERLISLINSMADGVLALDEKGDIVVYNGAALNVLDLNSSLQGKNISSVLHVVDQNSQKIDIKKYILSASTQQTSRDYKLVYPDESKINLYLSIAPVRLGFGEKGARGFVVLVRDITREKSLEEERDEFISVVSHELRTPIAIAEGNVGNAEFIVEKMHGNSQITAALKQAHEQILFLGGLINDLSTLSRAERGVLKVELQSINAHNLVLELADAYRPDAAKKGLSIKTELDQGLHLLKSSELYVREILQNFITNAIKYTEQGSVTIAASQVAKGVQFDITDTGIGISKTDQEKVFDKFFRSEDFRTRANSGTGLGLYVTMKLARLVHAEITLESEVDQGSTFSIFVPNLE